MSKCQISKREMSRSLLKLFLGIVIIFSASQLTAQEFRFKIDGSLRGNPPTVPGPKQETMTVGVIVNPKGLPAQFVEGETIIKSTDPEFVKSFAAKWSGRIISDGALPGPIDKLKEYVRNIPKTAGFYVVKVDPSKLDINKIQTYANKVGLKGNYTFSSTQMLQLFGLLLKEVSEGNSALTLDAVFTNDQCPTTFTREWPYDDAAPDPSLANDGYTDAYQLGCFNDADIRLTDAWELIDLLGANVGEVRLCIIDQGFNMNDDFPAYSGYDFVDDDRHVDADEADYHGRGTLSISCAARDNRFGSVGTGAQVAWPMAFRHNLTMWSTARAIRTAVYWGANVVSMSFRYTCDWWCALALGLAGDAVLHDAINEAYDNGLILLASAGNQELDLDEHFYLPVEGGAPGKSPIGVGAITLDTKEAVRSERFGWGSCYGSNVDIWAPGAGGSEDLFLWTTPTPESPDVVAFGGTSCASPYTAGIVAMMLAVNPTLSQDDAQQILQETANTSPDTRVETGYVNAYAAVRGALLVPGGITPAPDDLEPNDFTNHSPVFAGGNYCANLSHADLEDGYFLYLDDIRPVSIDEEQLLMGDYTAVLRGPAFDTPQPLPLAADLSPGGYYLRFQQQTEESPSFYSFQIDVGDPVTINPDWAEVNNTLETSAEIRINSDNIGHVRTVENLNFHVRGDPDYFELVLPELPNDPSGPAYTDQATIWIESSAPHISPDFRLTIYDVSGAAEPHGARAVTIDDVHAAYPDGRIRFLVYDGSDRRNFYRIKVGYDQYVRGIAPSPETLSFFEIPDWIEAERDRQFLDPPASFSQGLPFDLSFPSDPVIIESFLAGKSIDQIAPETIIVQWPYEYNLSVAFSFIGYSQELNFSLIDKKGKVIARAKDVSLLAASSGKQFPKVLKRIKVPNLKKGIYGILVEGSRFGTLYTLKFDPVKQTDVAQKTRVELPSEFALFQNYPNPFNPTTTIAFDVAKAEQVQIVVFDRLGRRVATLVNQKYEPGQYKVRFDAGQLATGLYFYRIRMGDFQQTRKMLLVR